MEEDEYFVEVEEDECYKPSEIDFDYEFDAARFFDFSRSETISEIIEAELWFQFSGNYPASPLIIKSKWGSGTSAEQKTAGSLSDSSMSIETPEAKSKSAPKLSTHRISTLMKPTASHLAKLKHAQKVYSTHIGERSLKAVNKSDEQSLQSSSGLDNSATKRQKLEIGYLCKVSHLKHQAQMLHKLSKKGGSPVSKNFVNYKLKVTVPKQPELRTLHRAQTWRSKNGLQSSEHEKQKTSTLKALLPLNKKIPEACLKPQPKKSKQKLPSFREFHLKTMERAMKPMIHSPDNLSSHHAANSVSQSPATYSRRPKAPSPLKQEKSERSPQTNSRLSNRKLSYGENHGVCQNTREGTTLHRKSHSSNNLRLLQHPPIELFNKMSLVPDTDTAAAISQPKSRLSGKGMKENAPDPFRHESSSKSAGKPNHSGIGRSPSKIGYHPSINRRLGIR